MFSYYFSIPCEYTQVREKKKKERKRITYIRKRSASETRQALPIDLRCLLPRFLPDNYTVLRWRRLMRYICMKTFTFCQDHSFCLLFIYLFTFSFFSLSPFCIEKLLVFDTRGYFTTIHLSSLPPLYFFTPPQLYTY